MGKFFRILKMSKYIDERDNAFLTTTLEANASELFEDENENVVIDTTSYTKEDPLCIDVSLGDCNEENKTLKKKFKDFSRKYFVIFGFLLFSGIGSAFSGLLLEYVEDSDVYKNYIELMTLVPPLISLIGNTVTTFASRLSTQVNLGEMKSLKNKRHATYGNFCLVTAQSTLVGAGAGICISIIATFVKGYAITEWLFMIAVCILCTGLSTLAITLLTLLAVFLCENFHFDPDNYATPLAASIADITTLIFLSFVSMQIFAVKNILTQHIICIAIILAMIAILPGLLYYSYNNQYTKEAFKQGWVPIVSGIILSGIAGQIFGISIVKYESLGLFQPFMNGLCGNIVSIMSSRTSTYLNLHSPKGELPKELNTGLTESPWKVLFSGSVYSRTARRLLSMAIFAHLIMGFILHFFNGYTSPFSDIKFLALFLSAAFIQVAIALYITNILLKIVWAHKWDPDSYAIPFMTAFSDLLGVSILFGVYYIYDLI